MDSVVLCEGVCKRWYHAKCAKLPQDKHRVIQDKEENRSLGLKCFWACKECRDRPDTPRDPEFESYVREKLGKLGQVLEYLVTKIQDIENRQKTHEVELNKFWQQGSLPSPRTTHSIFQEYGTGGTTTGQTTTSTTTHQQQQQQQQLLQTQQPHEETSDALYTFTGSFTGNTAQGHQSTASTNTPTTPPGALKEAMECHYDDCKCIKQEGGNGGSSTSGGTGGGKPCGGKHCNCTCKTHKIVMAHKKENVGKIHKCPYCEFTSKRSDNVKRHMLRHTGERPHKCPQCEFSAKRPHSLKKHMENVHKNQQLVVDMHSKELRADGLVR
ncbi:hypothetical protein Pmani_037380 [Petrolisthes manimaculis]|uniref:C2H2-type domain-containing protein n=1 Tax=Petrolisthes manimaculis TaxID=1843537 RepID=A0AAE1NHV3_9EUCA|nr:hypothetical protein Pmani_037380 [Petrolisthes manimaculis]